MSHTACRTSIVLDENIVQEALKLSNIKTKRVLTDTALKEFVARHKPKNKQDIRDLCGMGGVVKNFAAPKQTAILLCE